MWKRLLTIAICLFTFGSELVLDGSTSFVRTQSQAEIGTLSLQSAISSVNPIENNDLPQPDSQEVPDWAKTIAPSHSCGMAETSQVDFKLFVFIAPVIKTPVYQGPHPILFQRPPILIS